MESHVVCTVRLSLLTAAVRPVTLVSVTKVRLLPDRESLTEIVVCFFWGGGDSCDCILTVPANPCLTNVMSAHMAI